MEKKKVSRIVALFVAWIGCGLLLPMYIGDKEMMHYRIHIILRWIPWCIIGIGFVAIFLYMTCWLLMDMLNCVCGTLRYSDGTAVWRK